VGCARRHSTSWGWPARSSSTWRGSPRTPGWRSTCGCPPGRCCPPRWRWRRSGPRSRPELTEREREILDGVAAGLTNSEIGKRLYLSPKTVANNVTAILGKLQLAHRAEAIVRAREAGLGQ
jgi:DNA-binding CsgD family transcriptional regulator